PRRSEGDQGAGEDHRLSGDAEGVMGRRRARPAAARRGGQAGRGGDAESEDKLIEAVTSARREAKSAFGKDEVYLEKPVRHARHVEVQILGDKHGNLVHLVERDCSIQRRNQKVIERAPAPYVDDDTREALCEAALKIGKATDYVGAG